VEQQRPHLRLSQQRGEVILAPESRWATGPDSYLHGDCATERRVPERAEGKVPQRTRFEKRGGNESGKEERAVHATKKAAGMRSGQQKGIAVAALGRNMNS